MQTTKPSTGYVQFSMRRFIGGTGLHLLLASLAFTLVLPFVWMFLTSLKPLSQVGSEDWIPQSSVILDRGQFPVDRFQALRTAIQSDDSASALVLRERLTLDDPDLTPAALVDQLNAVIYGLPLFELSEDEVVSATQSGERNAAILRELYPGLVPEVTRLRWHNYIEVFRQIPFARYFFNSIFVACWVTFLQVFTSALAAYSFARLDWPGRDTVFLLYLTTMMLPGLVMMVPNYQVMITLGLVDTAAGLIIPAASSAFGTFLLRQFMLGIPSALEEAAEIDGASKWRIFWDVILPLSRPGLITLVIFTFMANYNSFFWPLVMLKSEYKYTLPIGLLSFDASSGQPTHLLMAAVTMSILPVVLIFIVLQRQLVKGIQLGGVKG